MTKMSNTVMFKRFGERGKTMRQAMNNTFLEHLMITSSAPFAYRAPHANRPTEPRKRFIG